MWVLQIEMEKSWTASDKENAQSDGFEAGREISARTASANCAGFWVDSPKGRINLELKNPQAEWEELQKLWDGGRERWAKSD